MIFKLFISYFDPASDFENQDGANCKKLLITGFDPFVLNDDPKMPENIRFGNPLQSNPSGVNALALHGNTIGDYFIQTLICPVRYKDFDEFKDGKGIIETFVQPFIQEVDMIITVSQGGVFRFDVDRFPCKNRGGFMDNMLWGNEKKEYNNKNFKQLTDGKEFYETTLPYQKIVPAQNNPNDTFWTYFNQTFNPKNNGDNQFNVEGVQLRSNFKNIESIKSFKGSGGDYLSNEIFYRVAKLRTESNRPNLATGHLHVPLTQNKGLAEDYNKVNSQDKLWFENEFHNIKNLTVDINPVIKDLVNNIKEIIKKV